MNPTAQRPVRSRVRSLLFLALRAAADCGQGQTVLAVPRPWHDASAVTVSNSTDTTTTVTFDVKVKLRPRT
jgi:hypothetical protein